MLAPAAPWPIPSIASCLVRVTAQRIDRAIRPDRIVRGNPPEMRDSVKARLSVIWRLRCPRCLQGNATSPGR